MLQIRVKDWVTEKRNPIIHCLEEIHLKQNVERLKIKGENDTSNTNKKKNEGILTQTKQISKEI